jgi:FkbM family methyltransferase
MDMPDPLDAIVVAACRHGMMHFCPADDTIGRSLSLYGEWGEAEVHLFAQIVRSGDTVIDAGANIGTHTVALAQLVGKHGCVHAFEPLPFSLGLLEANLAENGLPWVRCHAMCLGAATGSVTFPLVTPNDATNLGAMGFYIKELWPNCPTLERPIISIDSLELRRLDFIKIDVEGHELEVLDGAMATIAAKRPAIFVETVNTVAFTRHGDDGFAPQIVERLRPLGYSCWHYATPTFNPDNWRGCSDNVFPNLWSFDMLCVPRERFVVVGLPDAEIVPLLAARNSNWQAAAVMRIG